MMRVVLAYSGGLDTSVAIKWIAEHYNAEVITLTIDLGANDRDLSTIKEKALSTGAIDAVVVDGKEEFIRDYCFPALQAGAIYEGEYPLATALARPLIAKKQVEIARKYGAQAVAHGCTGKGNDQVRFDVVTGTLAPELKVIAPAREWGMSREEEIEYAQQNGIPVPVTKYSLYSVDANLWGRSCEAGALEDPWREPPFDAYEWTAGPDEWPDESDTVVISFEEGIPTALDGMQLDPLQIVERLHKLGGKYGVGRVDHIENRVVGIKSREIYEAPAAVLLHKAHQALEDLTLMKEQARFKARVALEYADLVYSGLWFSPHRTDLAAYVTSTQKYVTGHVKLRLHKGHAWVVGRQSYVSLYSYGLATYDKGDSFDHKAAEGFIKLFGLPLRTHAQIREQSSEDQAQPVEQAEAPVDAEPANEPQSIS